MFKTGLGSYLMPSFFKKGTKNDTSNTEPLPKELVFPVQDEDRNLVNISMNEKDDSYVDIQFKKLTYAEAAGLSKNKKQSTSARVMSRPSKEKVNSNQYEYLRGREEEDHLESSDHFEPLKSDVNYRKNQQFKNKQYESVQKKKQRKMKVKTGNASSMGA